MCCDSDSFLGKWVHDASGCLFGPYSELPREHQRPREEWEGKSQLDPGSNHPVLIWERSLRSRGLSVVRTQKWENARENWNFAQETSTPLSPVLVFSLEIYSWNFCTVSAWACWFPNALSTLMTGKKQISSFLAKPTKVVSYSPFAHLICHFHTHLSYYPPHFPSY